MHNNKKHLPPRFLAAAFASVSALGLSGAAEAEIMLYDKDQTTFSTDGYINAFYVNSKVDREGEQFDRRQSRVKMGFLPNYIGFNMGKQVDDLNSARGRRSGSPSTTAKPTAPIPPSTCASSTARWPTLSGAKC